MLMYKNIKLICGFICLSFLCSVTPAFAEETSPKPPEEMVSDAAGEAAPDAVAEAPALSLDEILAGIEKQYEGKGFTARFHQKSTIKAMEITDTAEGKLFIKRPGKMRWEYEKPEKQIITSDREQLWIYRPADNQVMMGKAPDYFGDGKGAGFLSDIRMIRKNFKVSLEESSQENHYLLKLVPLEKQLDLALIYIWIVQKEFRIDQVVTYNAYEDETIILLKNYQFDQNIDDAVFSFNIPEGADVVQLEQ